MFTLGANSESTDIRKPLTIISHLKCHDLHGKKRRIACCYVAPSYKNCSRDRGCECCRLVECSFAAASPEWNKNLCLEALTPPIFAIYEHIQTLWSVSFSLAIILLNSNFRHLLYTPLATNNNKVPYTPLNLVVSKHLSHRHKSNRTQCAQLISALLANAAD